MDLDRPWKVIRRTQEWVFSPKENYELIGDVPGVVFPCGVVMDKEENELRMYYGAADTSVALAIADMGDVMDYITHCPSI